MKKLVKVDYDFHAPHFHVTHDAWSDIFDRCVGILGAKTVESIMHRVNHSSVDVFSSIIVAAMKELCDVE